MTRLEMAQRLFGYDAEATPQLALEHARRWLWEAEWKHNSVTGILAELDNDAVYQWSYDSEYDMYSAQKREIVKRTPKQIRLAGKYRGDKQTYLPREKLEAGEYVQIGTGWWKPDYVFGHVIRPRLEEQATSSARHLENRRAELRRLEQSINNHEIILREAELHMIDTIMQLSAEGVARCTDPPKPNWRREGF